MINLNTGEHILEELPSVICGYKLSTYDSFKFSIAEVPEFCKAAWYGYYFIDGLMADADKSNYCPKFPNLWLIYIKIFIENT